ncbi:MAG: hypothetical protein AAGD15_08820 [Agrobacterium cavarae]|uniref:hypothetical protein n=1 Tax=Agrobacterium cavarae TaxID=2528239 RepID=UPI0013AE8DF2
MFDKAACFKLRHEPELMCTPHKIKEAVRLTSRFHLKYRDLWTVKIEIAFEKRCVTLLECPDIGQEFEIGQRFSATVSHIWSNAPIVAHDTTPNTGQTGEAGKAHPDHDIGPWQANIEGGGIASVQHPAIMSNDISDDAMLLSLFALRPIWEPAHISVDREVLSLKVMRDLPRKRCLSATGRADHQYARSMSQ